MSPLAPERHADKQARQKLIKCCALFASDKLGERAAAAAAAHRIIEQHDWTWSDIINPPEPQPAIGQQRRYPTDHVRNPDLDLAVRHSHACSDWEKNFVRSVAMQRSLSVRQRDCVAKIAQGLRMKGYL